jgi:hypothetical protein
MPHTASQPLAASAVEATKAPLALPLQTAKPKIVLDLARASGASEFTSVWFATIVARKPQSRSAERERDRPPDAEREYEVGEDDHRDAGDDDRPGAAQVELATGGTCDQDPCSTRNADQSGHLRTKTVRL